MAVEAALENVLALALSSNRVVQALYIRRNLASQSGRGRKGSEQECIEAAHLDFGGGLGVMVNCLLAVSNGGSRGALYKNRRPWKHHLLVQVSAWMPSWEVDLEPPLRYSAPCIRGLSMLAGSIRVDAPSHDQSFRRRSSIEVPWYFAVLVSASSFLNPCAKDNPEQSAFTSTRCLCTEYYSTLLLLCMYFDPLCSVWPPLCSHASR